MKKLQCYKNILSVIVFLLSGCSSGISKNTVEQQANLNSTPLPLVDKTAQDTTYFDNVSIPSTSPNQSGREFCEFTAPTSVILSGSPEGIVGIESKKGNACNITLEGRDLFLHGIPVSANGRKLVYRVVKPDGVDDMFVQDLITGEQIVYSVGGLLSSVFWLPDNRGILYSVVTGITTRINLHDFDVGVNSILVEADWLHLHSISADGNWFVYSIAQGEQSGLYIRSISDGTILRQIHDTFAPIDVVWSPDRKWIAITSSAEQPEPMTYATTDKMYLLNPYSGEVQSLSLDKNAYGLRWSPDSSKIAYFVVSTEIPSRTQICIFDLFTRKNRCIAEGRNPTWDPTGEYLAFRQMAQDKGCFELGMYDLSQNKPAKTSLQLDDFCSSVVPYAPLWIEIKP